jgi:hypothetical protein
MCHLPGCACNRSKSDDHQVVEEARGDALRDRAFGTAVAVPSVERDSET